MRRLLGSAILIPLSLALILAVAAVPLFTVYQSECGRGDRQRSEYNFVAPWSDPPAACRAHRSGFELVKDAVGLD